MTNEIPTGRPIQTGGTSPVPDVFRTWCEHCQEVVIALEPGNCQELVELGQTHPVEANVPRSMVCRGCLPKTESGE